TEHERQSNWDLLREAYSGDILIAGLGLGMVLLPILAREHVKSVTVIELSQDAIDLVVPHIRTAAGENADKLTVIQGDIFEWKPPRGARYHTIYFDIWGDISRNNLPDMRRLHQKFRRRKNSKTKTGHRQLYTKVKIEKIDVAWVPGAFEIPTVAGRLAASGRYLAVICLGAVVRGETTHDQHINRAVSMALTEIGVRCELPVLFGVLTCNSLEQAIARSGGQAATTGKDVENAQVGNKGVDCAEAALEMVDLMAKLPK
ncbi:hypothetical protein LCGC14_2347550, partial [marine sediment metagenome]